MLSVVVALYNEERRFASRFPELKAFLESRGEPWELLLVDDGSRDGTYAWTKSLSAADPRVRALRLERNLGQGAALKLGILATRGERVLYMDADLPVAFPQVSALLERLGAGADVVVASRWSKDAKVLVEQPGVRRGLGRVFYSLVSLLGLSRLDDVNCGVKAYRGETARVLFGFVRSWRWAFNVEHLWLAERFGYKVVEAPVEWSHEIDSRVKVFRDGVFTLWELGGIKLRQLFGIYPACRPG